MSEWPKTFIVTWVIELTVLECQERVLKRAIPVLGHREIGECGSLKKSARDAKIVA